MQHDLAPLGAAIDPLLGDSPPQCLSEAPDCPQIDDLLGVDPEGLEGTSGLREESEGPAEDSVVVSYTQPDEQGIRRVTVRDPKLIGDFTDAFGDGAPSPDEPGAVYWEGGEELFDFLFGTCGSGGSQ